METEIRESVELTSWKWTGEGEQRKRRMNRSLRRRRAWAEVANQMLGQDFLTDICSEFGQFCVLFLFRFA